MKICENVPVENFQRYSTQLFTWTQSSCVRERERREGEGMRGEREGEVLAIHYTSAHLDTIQLCEVLLVLFHVASWMPSGDCGEVGVGGSDPWTTASICHLCSSPCIPSHHFSSRSTPGTGGQHETCMLELVARRC